MIGPPPGPAWSASFSSSLASLQPGKVRYTMSALMEFTPDGLRVHTELCRPASKSDKRLAYEQVDEYLADPESWRKKLVEHQASSTIFEIAVQSSLLQSRRAHHDVDIMQMRMHQQSLNVPVGEISMLHIQPDTIKPKMRRELHERRDEVPHATHADGLVISDASQGLAFSHGSGWFCGLVMSGQRYEDPRN